MTISVRINISTINHTKLIDFKKGYLTYMVAESGFCNNILKKEQDE